MTSRGILPVQDIREAVEAGMISAVTPITNRQMQPASLDLRLGSRAWRVQSSFLPGAEMRVEDKLARLAMHQIDLSGGAVLERGCVYIVELQESLALESDVSAMANPKSSTGRLDIFTRLITDGALEFEAVAAGYQALSTPKSRRAHFLFSSGRDPACHSFACGVDPPRCRMTR